MAVSLLRTGTSETSPPAAAYQEWKVQKSQPVLMVTRKPFMPGLASVTFCIAVANSSQVQVSSGFCDGTGTPAFSKASTLTHMAVLLVIHGIERTLPS